MLQDLRQNTFSGTGTDVVEAFAQAMNARDPACKRTTGRLRTGGFRHAVSD